MKSVLAFWTGDVSWDQNNDVDEQDDHQPETSTGPRLHTTLHAPLRSTMQLIQHLALDP